MADHPEHQGKVPMLIRGGVIIWVDAPANSPAGGPGPGYFKVYIDRVGAGIKASYEYVNQQTRPLRDWASATAHSVVIYSQETIDGVTCVYEAIVKARRAAPNAILQETGRGIHDFAEGLIPGLLMVMGVLTLTTVAGGAVGALLGALGGLGAGAIPGGAIGAGAGFEFGVTVLTWCGLAMLVQYIGEKIGAVVSLTTEGVTLAWNARGKPKVTRDAQIEAGASKMAQAVGVFFRLVLEAIVMFLLEKGSAAVAERLEILVGKLKESKFGVKFAEWVEKNHQSLLNDPKLNPKLKAKKGGGTPHEEAPPPQKKPAPKEEPAGEPKKPTNAEKGVFGEAKADEFMGQKGYQKLNGDPVKMGDKPVGQGIDGVWQNPHPPPDYIITEAKYGSSKLGNTKDGRQMSDKWIDKRLDKAVGKSQADKIRDAQLEGKVEKWLLHVDEAGHVTKSVLK